MRSNEPAGVPPSRLALLGALTACLFLALCGSLWLHLRTVHAQENKRLTIYSPQATYSVAVTEHEGHDYVGVFEVFEPLGGIELKPSGGNWILQVDTNPRMTEGQFTPGQAQATVHGKIVPLPAPIVADGDRILVSTQSLPALLSAFLDAKTVLHAPGRRLFVNITGVSVSQELKSADPGVPESKSHVVLTFPGSVSPAISENGNQLRMVFSREPILPGSDINFNDPAIREIHFQENNGTLEVSITGTAPLAASLSNSGRQITITAVRMPSVPVAEVSVPPAATPDLSAPAPAPQELSIPGSVSQETGTQETITQGSAAIPGAPIPMATTYPKVVIVIDAGHGGSDTGARISDTIAEKDIVLAVARRLRGELQNRGFTTVMARDSDNAVPIDQRATLANATRPALYINLHANTAGKGVHIYTSLLRPVSPPPVFPLWDVAQAGWVDKSERIASMLSDSLNQSSMAAAHGKAALRPLDNIAAPAIALEFSPLSGGTEQITDPVYQSALAQAIANALVLNRSDLVGTQ